MDFSTALQPKFKDGTPSPKSLKEAARWTAMLKEAAEVVQYLPRNESESLHALMTGRYDLTALIAVILGKHKRGCDHLRIATLSFNRKNIDHLANLLASNVRRLTLLYSSFHREHSPETCRELHRRLRKEAAGRCRMAATRNHAKVVTMEFPGGERLVMEGSANLRTNSNQEQVTIIRSRDLHNWHAGWIDGMVTKHETEEKEE